MNICLIGSSRFAAQYAEVNRRLSLAGHVVYSIATVSTSFNGAAVTEALTPDQKETLDLVHLQKIARSEEVFVVTDETGYVGESTKREIKWATMCGIDVYTGDHYLNHHLCGKSDLANHQEAMLKYIRKAAADKDPGDCRDRLKKHRVEVFSMGLSSAAEPEAN
jgi:uncharacterized NAD-dependent epimerase/dehydratase family protein